MKLVTLEQVKKILELLKGLPAEHLQQLLESGFLSDLFHANVNEMTERISRDEFRKVCGLVPISTNFSIWKTIKLGTGLKTPDDFCKVLEDNGFKISNWAKDVLGKPAFTVAANKTEVDLVKVTVAEFGFKEDARYDQIFGRAKELGLDLCPAEVGPQLRLQYKDQPNGEGLLIGMQPISDSDGRLGVFDVRRGDSGLWLDDDYVSPDRFWIAGDQWIFVRPSK